MVREEIYLAIKERLGALDEVQHIDLWNSNVEFIEEDAAWARPAVFVEFTPILWEQVSGHREQRGSCQVRLHIVTDWSEDACGTSVFAYSKKIQCALMGLHGSYFHAFQLVETHTNHNHEEIVESIEVYKLRCVRSL